MNHSITSVVLGLLGFGLGCGPGVAAAQAPVKGVAAHPVALSIEAQPVGDSLNELARQTGLQVVLYTEIGEGIRALELKGIFTAQQAFDRLLGDTGLKYQFLDDKTVMVTSAAQTISATNGVVETMRLADGDDSKNSAAPFTAIGAESDSQGMQKAREAASAPNEDKPDQPAIQEIVVTAQKREERLQDVPMSITALSGEELVAEKISNARDLSFAVPGLSVAETGPGRQIIAIRGISGQRGTSSLTGVYLDEMPVSGVQDGFTGSAYADLRVIDLDRVEVLKGPQGTLFGEGAAGGVIRFITKDPDLAHVGGEIATELYNTADGGWSKEVSGVVNLPVATDVFGIRIAAKYEDIAGWIDQPTIGREDINDNEVKHVRVKALYAPTTAFRVKAMAEIHRNAGGAGNFVNHAPLSRHEFIQAVDRDARTDYADDYDMFNLTATYSFGFAELLSSTSYMNATSHQSFTQLLDGDPVPYLEILLPSYVYDSTNISQELRLTSSGEGPFNWTFGSLYKKSELSSTILGEGLKLILFGGTPNEFFIEVPSLPGATGRATSWAGFADGSFKLSEHIELGGGVRYFSNKREQFSNPTPSSIDSLNSSKTTYRIYGKYTFSPNANIYFNIGTGFRAGGFNGPSVVALGGPAEILPETTLFYELGAKTILADEHVRLNVALFYGEYQDMMADRIITSPVDGITPIQFTANGQSAKVRGVELELGWAATDRLTLSFNGDVTDTSISKVDPLEPAPAYIVGDPINQVPKYSVSAGVDYSVRWSNSVPGFVRVSFDRQGKAFYTARSFVYIPVKQVVAPELNFLNASVGAEWSGWNWSLFGRNLLDEDGYLNPTETGWSAQARPRTFGIGVSKRF